MDIKQIETWEAERKEWVNTLGEFILSCGEIEARTFEMLDDLISDDLPSLIKDMKFEQRNKFILALLASKVKDEVLLTNIRRAIKQARHIMSVRNVVAHNPLDLKVIGDSARLDTEQVIRRYYGNEEDWKKSEYTLVKLIESLTKAQFLASELGQLVYKLRVYLEER